MATSSRSLAMLDALRGLRRRGAAVALAGAAATLALTAVPAGAAAVAPPSGIGDTAVYSITVSPAYAQTGLIAAVASPLNGAGGNQKLQLWISHDGGHSWAQSPANGWPGGKPTIAVDGAGRETMYVAGGSSLLKSTDDGSTWTSAGGNGADTATAAPSYSHDGTVAVAGGNADYVVTPGGIHSVQGSTGKYNDFAFVYSPAFPSGGSHAPVLLSAIDSNKLPVILTCNAGLGCSGGAALPGAGTWSAPATLFPSDSFAADGAVFAQTGRGIYKSTDGGITFAPLTVVTSPGAAAQATPGLALAPGYSERGSVRTAYAAILAVYTDAKNAHTGGGIFRTDNGGATWSQVGANSPMGGGSQAVTVAPDGRVFAGYLQEANGQAFAGLLCSTDRGATWQASCPPVGTYGRVAASKATSDSHSAAASSTCPSPCASPTPAGDQLPAAAALTTVAGHHAPAKAAAGRGGSVSAPILLAIVAAGLAAAAGTLGFWLRMRNGKGTTAGVNR